MMILISNYIHYLNIFIIAPFIKLSTKKEHLIILYHYS